MGRSQKPMILFQFFGFLFFFGRADELENNSDDNFEHLSDVVSFEDLEKLNALSKEDKIRMIKTIMKTMDLNNDTFLEPQEIHSWIHYLEQSKVIHDAHNDIQQFDKDGDEKVSKEEYDRENVEWLEDPEHSKGLTQEDIDHIKAAHERDARRFIGADVDADGALNINEFVAFLHPYTQANMKHVLAVEAMEDLDTDKDGQVDIDEFINHITSSIENPVDPADPNWLDREREHFIDELDKDGDGMLNDEEMEQWVKEGRSHLDFATDHLLKTSDADQDGKLSEAEVVENYHHFLKSQATEWGQLLLHDEL